MAALSSAISTIKLAEYQRNEQAMWQHIPADARPSLTERDLALLGPFVEWCAKKQVRNCPASPASVAVFVTEHAHRGQEFVFDTLEAIAALHDRHGLSNPTATVAVRLAVCAIAEMKPPRAWNKQEKLLFGCLPPEIAYAVSRCERAREKGLRQAQNKLAEVRQKLKPEKETENAS
jgi:hypothetical protein